MRGSVARTVLAASAFLISFAVSAQASNAAGGQTYTLRTSARNVLTDVIVLDDHGRPVHGLAASACLPGAPVR